MFKTTTLTAIALAATVASGAHAASLAECSAVWDAVAKESRMRQPGETVAAWNKATEVSVAKYDPRNDCHTMEVLHQAEGQLVSPASKHYTDPTFPAWGPPPVVPTAPAAPVYQPAWRDCSGPAGASSRIIGGNAGCAPPQPLARPAPAWSCMDLGNGIASCTEAVTGRRATCFNPGSGVTTCQ
jgi:hypothetical protein